MFYTLYQITIVFFPLGSNHRLNLNNSDITSIFWTKRAIFRLLRFSDGISVVQFGNLQIFGVI